MSGAALAADVGVGGELGIGAIVGESAVEGAGVWETISSSLLALAATIICSELHRQGLISDRQRRYGMMYAKQVGEEVYKGYLISAEPIVKRMQKSKLYTRFVSLFAIPAIKEMTHRVHPRSKGSLFGSLVLHFGVRHCIKVYDRKSSEVADGLPC
jgi:hypothetical protein